MFAVQDADRVIDQLQCGFARFIAQDVWRAFGAKRGHRCQELLPGQGGERVAESLGDLSDRSLGQREPDFVTKELAGGEKSICVSCSRCFVLPHMHPGIRCVWAWKKERARQKQAVAQK